MNENYEVSPATKAAAEKTQQSGKPGIVLFGLTISVLILNLLASFRIASLRYAGDDAYGSGQLFGYTTASAFFFQFIVMALFAIGKRFRNQKSMLKIYCWTSLFVLLANFGTLGPLVRAN